MKSKNIRQIGISGFITLILIIFDQLTKYLAVINLKDKQPFTILENIFELHYLENQSAAFGSDIVSILQRIFKIQYFYDNPDKFITFKMIVFAILTVIVVALLIIAYLRIPTDRRYFWINICIILFI